MMPMLMEMPQPGLWGLKCLSLGTRFTVLGTLDQFCNCCDLHPQLFVPLRWKVFHMSHP